MSGLFRRSATTRTESDHGSRDGMPATYLSPYRAAVDRHGARFESLLWNSVDTQRIRFEVIASMINLSGAIITDAGCGRADLALWLRASGVHWRRYIGIDAIPEMLTHARGLDLPHADFHDVDFISDENAFMCAGEAPDVIIFSGSLNTIPRPLIARALERAWRSCRTALVFNFLSSGDTPPPDQPPAGSAQKLSPPTVMKWALHRTPSVQLRHDYLDGRDGTIVMRKSPERRPV